MSLKLYRPVTSGLEPGTPEPRDSRAHPGDAARATDLGGGQPATTTAA